MFESMIAIAPFFLLKKIKSGFNQSKSVLNIRN